jgi:hypothetical protein
MAQAMPSFHHRHKNEGVVQATVDLRVGVVLCCVSGTIGLAKSCVECLRVYTRQRFFLSFRVLTSCLFPPKVCSSEQGVTQRNNSIGKSSSD